MDAVEVEGLFAEVYCPFQVLVLSLFVSSIAFGIIRAILFRICVRRCSWAGANFEITHSSHALKY